MQVPVTTALFGNGTMAAAPFNTGVGALAAPIEDPSPAQITEPPSVPTFPLSRRNFLKVGLFGGVSLAVGCLGGNNAAVKSAPGEQQRVEIKQKPGLENDPISSRRGFLSRYKEYTQEHPYISAVATGMIIGGWMRVFGDAIIRGKEKDYDAKRWIWFHLISTILYDMEKVPIYRLLEKAFPTYQPNSDESRSEKLSGSFVSKFLKTCALSVLYGIPWTWRHNVLMDWVDKGKAPFPEAFSGKYLNDTVKTWLPGEAWLFPTDYFIQNHLPQEFRIFGVMVLQRLPMQMWYTYRHLAVKKVNERDYGNEGNKVGAGQ